MRDKLLETVEVVDRIAPNVLWQLLKVLQHRPVLVDLVLNLRDLVGDLLGVLADLLDIETGLLKKLDIVEQLRPFGCTASRGPGMGRAYEADGKSDTKCSATKQGVEPHLRFLSV
ncbi:hypothetical protein GCM10011499_38660 [Pelagibacterium lentulum]|uniref:Uncharacterized protein n=1 Tax=Pelagibacterium lentulum TaxID=2029865 RepID=A0A916RP10_9HYPH|nr:hypothetical protein GCM10011499_38660 [Pelagibacterium lentulum]